MAMLVENRLLRVLLGLPHLVVLQPTALSSCQRHPKRLAVVSDLQGEAAQGQQQVEEQL